MQDYVEILGIKAKVAKNFRERARGLIGHKAPPPGTGLLIPKCNAIHTFFMSYPIDAIFINSKGEVVKIVRSIPPWKFFIWGSWRAKAVLEIAST